MDWYTMAVENSIVDPIFDPIASTTIKDVIRERLKAAIISGRFAPGERLVEQRVAAMLNVSRTPLREAIRLLEQERLVERLPQGGVRVSPISPIEIKELYEIRVFLESLTARNAARVVRIGGLSSESRTFLAEMQLKARELEESEKDTKLDERLRIGRQFHRLVYKLSGNQRCKELLDDLLDSMERYRATAIIQQARTTPDAHVAIADAIARGNEDLAERLMREHIEKAAATIAIATTKAFSKST